MKMIYYASYLVSATFFVVALVLYATSAGFSWIGDTIHDYTTYRAWAGMHRRVCAKMSNAAGQTPAARTGDNAR